MDHRALLKKYIRHVLDFEGISFVGVHDPGGMPFSAAEQAELEALEAEAEAEDAETEDRDERP